MISSEPGIVEIAVRRDDVVEDGYAQLNGLGSKLKSSVYVSFVDELGLKEDGLGHGGFSKDFLTDFAKEAFDPGYEPKYHKLGYSTVEPRVLFRRFQQLLV